MFKGILKYYFFCLLFASSLFISTQYAGFVPQQQSSSRETDLNISRPVCGIAQSTQFNNNDLETNSYSLVVNNPTEEISSLKNKFISQRPPHQTKLKETGKVKAKFLSANLSNSHNKELTHSRQTDKSNHRVFRI